MVHVHRTCAAVSCHHSSQAAELSTPKRCRSFRWNILFKNFEANTWLSCMLCAVATHHVCSHSGEIGLGRCRPCHALSTTTKSTGLARVSVQIGPPPMIAICRCREHDCCFQVLVYLTLWIQKCLSVASQAGHVCMLHTCVLCRGLSSVACRMHVASCEKVW